MISHCMHHAMRIAKLPLDEWPAEVKRLPDSCVFDDCTVKSCRKRVSDYLRVQWKCAKRLEKTPDP